MQRAVEVASSDAGTREVVAQVDWIGTPEGTWPYRDPGRLLAARLDASTRARASAITTVVADVGILQQDLLNAACAAVVQGARTALVVGGETKYRALQAVI